MEALNGHFSGTFHPIPLELWSAIVGFHRQVSINLHAESLTLHRWHQASACYHTLIPWQQTRENGLSVDVDWKDERNVKLLNDYAKQFGEEFLPACSIHTHVDIHAFESGTDAEDECNAPGWHITLGHLLYHDSYDIHYRMRVPQIKRLKAIIDTTKHYKLTQDNLFSPEEGLQKWLETTPGTTELHPYLNRVECKQDSKWSRASSWSAPVQTID